MAQSSFYGGRQGSPFIIVEHFDGINIPQSETAYRTAYLAVTNDRNYFVFDNGFIYRDANNYQDYLWQRTLLDGRTVSTKANKEGTGDTSSEVLDLVPAKGMVQCFEQGGATTNIVNYGEYVIIDTPNKTDPDNGKIFRRGMNYDISETNPLAGAEYIGQVVGPQGEAVDLDFDLYDNIIQEDPHEQGDYNVNNGGIVSGKENDRILYAYTTIRDEFDNIIGSKIGFKIPYLVTEFNGRSRSPYYTSTDIRPAGKAVGDRLNEDFPLVIRTDDDSNPFYRTWRIDVPMGIKGDSSIGIEKIETQALAGSTYYYDQACLDSAGVLSNNINLDTDNIDYSLSYLPVIIGSEIYYIKNDGSSTGTSILRYTETRYDNKVTGENTYIPIGAYNTIKSISIADNGDVYINYSYDNLVKLDGVHLRWVDSMEIKQNGEYIITYNDETTDEGNIYFIGKINIAADGTVTYYYTDDDETVAGTQEKIIRWIENVTIDTRDGNGSQRVTVTYNNDKSGSISEEIGDPLNFILEAVITESRPESPTTEPYHLLVLYSDPIKRAEIVTAGNNATYRSIYPDNYGNYIRNDWLDLGSVRGAKGGLGILSKLTDVDLLNDDSTSHTPIPPEYMMDAIDTRAGGNDYILNPPQGMDPQYSGWLMAIDVSTVQDPDATDLYFYDYGIEQWVKIAGGAGTGGAKPEEVVRISNIAIVPSNPDLEENGLWFVSEIRKIAN